MPGAESKARLTFVGRATLLLLGELFANVLLWAIAAALFVNESKKDLLSLCLISWTLGLRHALDSDHICAIDLSTRRLIALGQRPVTVGLFFSLGHSTVVIVATICVIISTSIANKLDKMENIGGTIGTSVSASFLLLIAFINSIILYRNYKERKRLKAQTAEMGPNAPEEEERIIMGGCLTRMTKPLFKIIDRPWKLYIIGLLFGLGFDTASSILLLSVSAIATTAVAAHPGQMILLPLLFAAGMTAIDSVDAVFMSWAYTAAHAFPEDDVPLKADIEHVQVVQVASCDTDEALDDTPVLDTPTSDTKKGWQSLFIEHRSLDRQPSRDLMRQKQLALSQVSMVLTLMSIILAFCISFIEFMGLASDQLDGTQKPGLEGRWWRFWSGVNDNSGWIGIGIVGAMIVTVCVWFLVRKLYARAKRT